MAGKPHQVHGGLSVTGAPQHASVHRFQGRYVPWEHEVLRTTCRIRQLPDGFGSVFRTHTRAGMDVIDIGAKSGSLWCGVLASVNNRSQVKPPGLFS